MNYLRRLIVGIAASCIACASGTEPEKAGEIGTVAAPLVESASTTRLRIVTFNTWMLPPEAKGAPIDLADNYVERADAIADRILSATEPPDIVALNEVFSEEARDRLSDRLFGAYPYIVLKIEHSNAVDFEQDSGLMLFSKLPFADFPNPPSSSNAKVTTRRTGVGTEEWWGDTRFVPAQIYDETYCPSIVTVEDCYAAKGVGMVRVVQGGRAYNLAFTHMQADMESGDARAETRAVRDRQLRQIRASLQAVGANLASSSAEETLVLGDLNAEGWIKHPTFGTPTGTVANPGPGMLAAEYGQGIWKQLDKASFFDVWRTTSPEDEGITNAAGTNLARFDYFLMNGAGHYDRTSPSLLLNNSFAQGGCPQWVRRTLQNAPSDHIGLALDVGPGSSFCAPALADHVNGTTRSTLTGTLTQPGENVWYRLDTPGTYSLGFLSGTDLDKIAFSVFPVGDLSHPLERSRLLQPGQVERPCPTPGALCQFDREVFFFGHIPSLYSHLQSARSYHRQFSVFGGAP